MPIVQTPDWVKDAVFYQIFPDRFAHSTRVPKAAHLERWDTPATAFGYKGGDLLGVVDKLDYLQDLGVTALYFTPVFQSACNHRYHTHDYYQVDPMLGGNAALHALLHAAHQRGLKVVLDGVFNHASRGFFQFHDILENGPASAYLDWFTVRAFPTNAYDMSRPADYAAWYGLHALPKFNHANPTVREYLMQVGEYWLRQGIDGWRLDVPAEITAPGFWEEFRTRMKAINPEAYIVGEIWHLAPEFLRGDRFDGLMNYVFAADTISFVTHGHVRRDYHAGRSYQPDQTLTAEQYAEALDRLLAAYPWEITLTQLNLLDSHDAARLISLAEGDHSAVALATLLLFTFPGAPSVYYGDEIALPGGLPDCETRQTFPWDRPHLWHQPTLAWHKALIALRRAHPALRRGTYHRLYAHGDGLAFARRLGADVVLVALNRAAHPLEVTVPVADLLADGRTVRPLFGDPTPVHVQAGQVTLTLPARAGLVLG